MFESRKAIAEAILVFTIQNFELFLHTVFFCSSKNLNCIEELSCCDSKRSIGRSLVKINLTAVNFKAGNQTREKGEFLSFLFCFVLLL